MRQRDQRQSALAATVQYRRWTLRSSYLSPEQARSPGRGRGCLSRAIAEMTLAAMMLRAIFELNQASLRLERNQVGIERSSSLMRWRARLSCSERLSAASATAARRRLPGGCPVHRLPANRGTGVPRTAHPVAPEFCPLLPSAVQT